MFVDYYEILEIDFAASPEEIKIAFKKQALKWHPDKNPGKDTTELMQLINEAKLILLDTEARERYNKEYLLFKEYKKKTTHKKEEPKKDKFEEKEKTHYYSDYSTNDEELNRWMNNAKRQAVGLAKQTIEDLKGMVAVGTKAAVKEGANYLLWYTIAGVVIFVLARACN